MSCRKIRSVLRNVKWCFAASWGHKCLIQSFDLRLLVKPESRIVFVAILSGHKYLAINVWHANQVLDLIMPVMDWIKSTRNNLKWKAKKTSFYGWANVVDVGAAIKRSFFIAMFIIRGWSSCYLSQASIKKTVVFASSAAGLFSGGGVCRGFIYLFIVLRYDGAGEVQFYHFVVPQMFFF